MSRRERNTDDYGGRGNRSDDDNSTVPRYCNVCANHIAAGRRLGNGSYSSVLRTGCIGPHNLVNHSSNREVPQYSITGGYGTFTNTDDRGDRAQDNSSSALPRSCGTLPNTEDRGDRARDNSSSALLRGHNSRNYGTFSNTDEVNLTETFNRDNLCNQNAASVLGDIPIDNSEESQNQESENQELNLDFNVETRRMRRRRRRRRN